MRVSTCLEDLVAFAEREDIDPIAKAAIVHAQLAEQPVVDTAYVAEHLGITRRAATALIDRGCAYGMLSPMGSRRRGVFYQSEALIAILEDISSISGIRRVLAR